MGSNLGYTKLSPEEIEQGFKEYKGLCEEKEDVFTIIDLAEYLDIDRDTLWNYGKKEQFSALIKRIKDYAENSLVKNGLKGSYNPTMAIFLLKANHGLQDKQVIEQDTTLKVNLFKQKPKDE